MSADLPLIRWQPWPRDRAASVRRLSLRSKGVPRQRQRPLVARAATACFGCRRRAVEAAAADCARGRPSGWRRTGNVTWHGRPGCGAKVSRRIFENARPAAGGRNTSIAQPRSVWFFLWWRAEIKWSRSGPSVEGLTRGREEDGGRHIVRVLHLRRKLSKCWSPEHARILRDEWRLRFSARTPGESINVMSSQRLRNRKSAVVSLPPCDCYQ